MSYYMTKIVVSNFQFLDGKQGNPGSEIGQISDSKLDNQITDPKTTDETDWDSSKEFDLF